MAPPPVSALVLDFGVLLQTPLGYQEALSGTDPYAPLETQWLDPASARVHGWRIIPQINAPPRLVFVSQEDDIPLTVFTLPRTDR